MISAPFQAAGEYAAAAGQAGAADRPTGIEGLDRLIGLLDAGWSHFVTLALEHPVLALVAGLVLGLIVERLLIRRRWGF